MASATCYQSLRSPLKLTCLLLLVCALCGCGNAAKKEYRAPVTQKLETSQWQIAPAWESLRQKLAKDGISGPQVDALLAQLAPEPTQSPMGRKILELYQKQFYPSPKKAQPLKYYKGVVTQANAELCRKFIAENQAAFQHAWLKYGVPPNIAAALLFVETRLGKVLGDVPENAFYTLASMAITDQPKDIPAWLPKLKDYQKHLSWLDETMRKRSNWAYKETAALIRHMIKDTIAPQSLPGSIYGAVGLCQFMPSNISVYGADGDGDNRVDLFTVPDAVASLANYLNRNGWKPGLSQEGQHKALMTYNHSKVYANTILALAALISQDNTPA